MSKWVSPVKEFYFIFTDGVKAYGLNGNVFMEDAIIGSGMIYNSKYALFIEIVSKDVIRVSSDLFGNE